MWNYLTTPAVPTPRPSLRPSLQQKTAPADFIRHNLVFLKALLRDACRQSLQLVAWIWTTDPCDTSDQALMCEERILMLSVHGNISGGNSIPDVQNRKEWCVYTSIEMFLSFGLQQEYTLK